MGESQDGRMDRRKVEALESIAKSLKAIAEPVRISSNSTDDRPSSIISLTESGIEPMSDRD